MRLLLVHDGFDLYGASRSFLRLATRLKVDGHEVLTVLLMEGPLAGALREQEIAVVINRRMATVMRRKTGRVRWLARLIVRVGRSVLFLSKLVREFKPHLIHTNTALAFVSGFVARCQRVPHVWHIREFFTEFPRMWKIYQWYMFVFSDRIIAVSRAVSEQFHPRIRRERVRVLHNGFPASEFPPVEDARKDGLRRRFGLTGAPIVGVVGRLKPGRKGQDIFLRAVPRIAARWPQAHFVLIGSVFPGNEDQEVILRELARELGIDDRITITGDVEDIKGMYSILDVSVVPSALPEHFGGVTIESMAMGCAVVATRTGGTPEQVIDGDTGFLAEPSDPDDLSAAIMRLLEDPVMRRRMGEAGRRRFEECFEFESFYPQLIEIYRDASQLEPMETANAPPLRILVAGQLPPPYGGQNLNIERFLRLLRATEGRRAEHWKFDFTRSWATTRRGSFAKMVELARVFARLARLRLRGRIDYVLYPSGGPRLVPNVRDALLLPAACLVADRVCVHFQAAGQAAALPNFPAPLRWLLKAAHRRCFGAIVLTEFGRCDAEALGLERISVIPNAVGDQASGFTERRTDGVSAAAMDPVLLSVGHLCPDKGTPELLEGCARLKDAGRSFRLRLVGECLSPYSEEDLLESIGRLGLSGTVEWRGLLRGPELAEAYRTADLFIWSTVAPGESFGLVLIEAMMWGLPVVTTDWRANAEVAGSAEPQTGGICFPIEGDLSASLASAVDGAFEHREQWVAWGRNNRERYENLYRIDVLKENLWEYFHQDVARRKDA